MSETDLEPTAKKPAIVLRQTDVPGYSLKEALRVVETLRDQYGKQPTRPLMIAKAMGMSPSSGPFRMITGAAAAYELTEGAAKSSIISLAPLGRRAVAPTTEGDEVAALREAVLKPRIMREFLGRYDGSKLPSNAIALNVLEEMGVPGKAVARAYSLIVDNAEFVGFVEDLNGSKYINMTVPVSQVRGGGFQALDDQVEQDELLDLLEEKDAATPTTVARKIVPVTINTLATNKRVFISHGKNKSIVEQLREVLSYGGFEPVVSVDKETTATPVPDKVMDDMRSCGAGIVNVGTDKAITDNQGVEHKILNPNVLIEIGAALALYKRNFILLVETGVELPSNLRGLYEVRYTGSTLDYEATMKLLKAFNEFKSNVE